MANMLDKYVDAVDEVAAPATESISKTKAKAKRQRFLKKKEIRALKALAKAFRKHNELMEQEAARRKAEEDAAEKAVAKQASKNESDNGMRGFLHKLGNAICKAVPGILTTLTTLIFGHFVKMRSTGKALQFA